MRNATETTDRHANADRYERTPRSYRCHRVKQRTKRNTNSTNQKSVAMATRQSERSIGY